LKNRNEGVFMSVQRNRLDPESREPLEGLLQAIPGGFNAIEDLDKRRAVVAQLLVEPELDQRVTMEDRLIPGPTGEQLVRIYRPVVNKEPMPALINIHGGGMVLGSVQGDAATAQMLAAESGAIVFSIDYRKAPENPYPAAVNDCFSASQWVFENAKDLGIDANNIGIYGGSAGGGLALAVCLMARDQSGMKFKYMMPIYPMIDDRNQTQSTHDVTEVGIWDRAGNIEAWGLYLGGEPADGYAAPARMEDLANLPPAYIDVGEMDAFRDEDAEFALRLIKAGVPCEFRIYPGAYHASEVFAPEAALSRRIWAGRLEALRRFIAS
jgi:acetyl esterase/lipase